MSKHPANHTTSRIYHAEPLAAARSIPAREEHAHYLLQVMRLEDGDHVRLFNADDGEWQGRINITGKKKLTFEIETQLRPAQTRTPDLWLYAAPIKKAHFEYMVEKATELGVTHIQPTLTNRTQVRDANQARLTDIATESAEQSERLSVPTIHAPVTLGHLLKEWPKDRQLIVCAEWGTALAVDAALRGLKNDPQRAAAILTGPEGGLTAEELEDLRKVPDVLFIRLGPRILRADTAAIAALTCWQAIQGDWSAI